eukprot:2171760-Pleurochrysis_carterae.AAC.1
MRRAGAAFGVSQLAGAEASRGEVVSTTCAAPGSASRACRQKALPFASVVNAMSPPLCAKRALKATSDSDCESVFGSAFASAARES